LQILIGQFSKDLHRLAMHSIEEIYYILIAIGQFTTVAGIAAVPALDSLAIHISFDRCQMTQNIGKTEFSIFIAPIDLIGRNAGYHSVGAGANLFIVVEKWSNRINLH